MTSSNVALLMRAQDGMLEAAGIKKYLWYNLQ
jgi:hypothetical protein